MSYRVDEKLIEALLCHRMQQVKINVVLSSSQRVLSGTPRETVSWPLFIISINDLLEVCNDLSKKFLFADNAKLYKCISDISDCESLNNSCQHIFNWSEKWCMKLNVDKCKVLSIKEKIKTNSPMCLPKTKTTLL